MYLLAAACLLTYNIDYLSARYVCSVEVVGGGGVEGVEVLDGGVLRWWIDGGVWRRHYWMEMMTLYPYNN